MTVKTRGLAALTLCSLPNLWASRRLILVAIGGYEKSLGAIEERLSWVLELVEARTTTDFQFDLGQGDSSSLEGALSEWVSSGMVAYEPSGGIYRLTEAGEDLARNGMFLSMTIGMEINYLWNA